MSLSGSQDNSDKPIKFYQFKGLLQTTGWITSACVGIDFKGTIVTISDKPLNDDVPCEEVNGFAVPGFQNAHSHAFQFAMAGMAETHKPGTNDDFWSWREAMYDCALRMNPDQIQSVATRLYAEMLKRGYTHVAEFQYLHHGTNGKPYHNLSEISVSLLAAAALAGIRITIVPVFYQKGGFQMPAQPRQKRFIFSDVDQYFRLLEETASVVKNMSTAKLGFGVHSLRAATPEDIMEIRKAGPAQLPFHIHAAEQRKEVEDCVRVLGQRPVEWIVNNLEPDNRFHLVHCTHMDDREVEKLARSGAHVVLCPGTEANLGDGIFRLADYARHNGNWSIGTDSHISLNPLEDLRWLDYGQRLTSHKRNTFDDGASVLIHKTIRSGRKAMGVDMTDFFEIGKPFDAAVYDAEEPLFLRGAVEHVLPTLIYTADSAALLGTIVNGQWIIKRNNHNREEQIRVNFNQTIKKIYQ